MHSYAALLGNNRSISIAELAALLPDFRPTGSFSDYLTFETKEDLNQDFLQKIGGTILLAKRVTTDSLTTEHIPQLMMRELDSAKGKVVFALRFFGVSPNAAKNLYMRCKKGLKQGGKSSRFVGSERDPAKPIQLHDEGLLDPKKGCELVMLQDKTSMWIGRTVAAQNVKFYTKRDMEKPVRDTKVGLLPPKLAQVLLNLGVYLAGGEKKGMVIADPFCGTGVIPMEALLRGFSVLASDVSEKAVKGCSANIEWTRKTYKILKKDAESTVWKQDATKPFALKELPHVIVSEGTLGPALKDRPTVKDAETMCRNAEDLTARFLKNCSETMKGVPIVMTLPVWYAQKRMIWLQKIWDKAAELGYSPVLPPHVDPTNPGRFSLLYRRADQMVGREIIMLRQKK